MAENDGKLYIIITDQPVVNSTQTITENVTTTTDSKKEKELKITEEPANAKLKTFAIHQAYHFLQQSITESVNWSIANIGNFTGDYIKQSNVQHAMSLTNKLVGIGSSVVAGATIGGPIGALIAGTIAVVSTGVSVILEDISNSFQVKKQNREIAQLRELSGLNPLTNGGRI